MQLLPREVLLPCQIFGWFPLKYVDNAGNKVVEFSYSWFFWGLTVTLTYSTISILALHLDFEGRQEGQPIIMQTNTSAFTVLVDRVALCTLGTVVFVSTAVRYPLFIEMYNKLQKLDEALQLKKKDSNNFKYIIVGFLTLKTIVVIISIYYYTDLCHSYIVYIPYYITYFVQATVVIFFINVCSVIKERFCEINEKMRKEVIKQSFGQLLRGVEECHGNSDYTPGGVASLTKIRSLTEQYWLLCEFMRKTNQFLSWHLFVSVVSLSVHTIITLFNLFSAIWPIIQREIAPQLVLRSVWFMINTVELLGILRASTSMTDMAHGTAPTVCKLINRNMSAPLKKHVINTLLRFLYFGNGNLFLFQLEIFLLSLRHQNAKFSALGLFQVQSHILTPIAGAITTYLVILIQLQAQTPKES